jgi:hypothetical protein
MEESDTRSTLAALPSPTPAANLMAPSARIKSVPRRTTLVADGRGRASATRPRAELAEFAHKSSVTLRPRDTKKVAVIALKVSQPKPMSEKSPS